MLRSSRHTLLAALLLAAVIPYFLNLGVSSIWDANEAFYAQTPREMIGGARLRHAQLQLSAADEQAGALVLERRSVLSVVRHFRMERAVADCDRRRGHHWNRIRPWTAPGRHGRRPFGRGRAGDVAAADAAGAAHHHRHSHHDVDRPRAALFCPRRDEARTAAAVPVPDVRGCGASAC